MDPWLQDEVKELLAGPCLATASAIGSRLENRLRMKQSIDERALTEDFVDVFDTSSSRSAWGAVLSALKERQVFVSSTVRKSTKEYQTGADIGLILQRNVHQGNSSSHARYAVLIQCKRVDARGRVEDFFHKVRRTQHRQCDLLLELTPSSFYFIFIPPSLVHTYCSVEPIAFVQGAEGCSSPVWNMGSFGHRQPTFSFLRNGQQASATSILVVPAMAVSAQQVQDNPSATIEELLPNTVPFWYWFTEMFVPGFVGDRRPEVLAVARNERAQSAAVEETDDFGVRFAMDMTIGNG